VPGGTLGRVIHLYLHARALPGARPAVESFLAEARAVYEEPDGVAVRLQWSTTDPDAFVEIMEYADEATWRRDQERVEHDPRMRALIERWHGLLASGPVVSTYEDVPITVP
jgi:hypothetical protein